MKTVVGNLSHFWGLTVLFAIISIFHPSWEVAEDPTALISDLS